MVLPGFVWEANFGDVTGKLVDGPLTIVADTQDAAGNRAYLDDAQRAAEMDRMRKAIRELCN